MTVSKEAVLIWLSRLSLIERPANKVSVVAGSDTRELRKLVPSTMPENIVIPRSESSIVKYYKM
jgi:hypothetical protein